MVRKKSGELVRPALKTRKSTSTPNSTGINGEEDSDPFENSASAGFSGPKSAPSTPYWDDGSIRTPKNVKFAGEDGGRKLENVVLFKRDQKVTSVSRVMEGEDVENLQTETETENEQYDIWGRKRSTFGATSKALSAQSSSASSSTSAIQHSDEDIRLSREISSKIPRMDGLNFDPHNGRGIRTPEFEPDMVMLESVNLASGVGGLSLKGTAVVRNVSFGKWLGVKFSKSLLLLFIALCFYFLTYFCASYFPLYSSR